MKESMKRVQDKVQHDNLEEIGSIKDDVKVYIRHCEERTVPILEWFFRDFETELINGVNRRFADVLEEMFLKIKGQKQRLALVFDGDLVPVITVDEIVRLFIMPLYKTKNIITLNGDRIDKFFTMNRALIGGIKAYKKDRIERYLKNIDKKQIRPESFLYNKVGYFAHLRTKIPQVGHEYGQFLWHLYEKAIQRGAKATKEEQMRESDDIDFIVYKEAYSIGKELKNEHVPNSYRKNNLPLKYLKYEKDSIPLEGVESAYLRLKEEIDKDIRKDIGNVIDKAVERDIKEDKWLLLKKLKKRFYLQ
jgi:hypothetical protein